MGYALPLGNVGGDPAMVRGIAEAAGHDPAAIGLEAWISCAEGGEAEWREEFLWWKQAGQHMLRRTTATPGITKNASGSATGRRVWLAKALACGGSGVVLNATQR